MDTGTQRFACRRFIGKCSWEWQLQGRKRSSNGQKEELNYNAVVQKPQPSQLCGWLGSWAYPSEVHQIEAREGQALNPCINQLFDVGWHWGGYITLGKAAPFHWDNKPIQIKTLALLPAELREKILKTYCQFVNISVDVYHGTPGPRR